MSHDRSLDEFLSRDASPDQETDESPNDGRNDAEDEEQPLTLTVHPARSTMAWTADDVACDACGEVVQRRWRDDDQFVCSACKEW